MVTFSNHGRIIAPGETPPDFRAYPYLFIDFETTSKNCAIKSLNPWKVENCGVAGVAVTASMDPTVEGRFAEAIYIPCEHRDVVSLNHGGNIDKKWTLQWLIQQLLPNRDCPKKFWVNSNVKYDVAVLFNNAEECGIDLNLDDFDILQGLHYIDTVTVARIIDSDRFTYGLKELSRDWLGRDISEYEKALQPYLPTKGKHRNLDYGLIPIDVLGEYACQDVLSNRELFEYIEAECPEDCRRVWFTEIDVTRELLDIEFEGMRIKPDQLRKVEAAIKKKLLEIREKIKSIISYDIEPNNAKDCYDLLSNSYGLPVIEWTDAGNPSYSKHVLEKYKTYIGAPEEVLDLMLEYRELHTLNNLFVEPYQYLHKNGRLHPSYKQTLRTGRMGCGKPNMQQLSKMAKKLIHADEDCVILSIDYSQIEFRLIVHYINDAKCIDAYHKDPNTDFHQWVADECEIHRRPAKNINFMLGFGGGKKKTVSMLSQNKELVAKLREQVASLPEEKQELAFTRLANRRAEDVYNTYHGTLPGVKRTSRAAMNACLKRGYVYNLYRRRRHLPKERAHIAFNTLNQGSAADLMKDRIVRVNRTLRRWAKKNPDAVGSKVIGAVHDEFVFKIPKKVFCKQLVQELLYILETPDIKLRVPIRCSVGFSDRTWYAANTVADTKPNEEGYERNLSNIERLSGTHEFKLLEFVQPECLYETST